MEVLDSSIRHNFKIQRRGGRVIRAAKAQLPRRVGTTTSIRSRSLLWRLLSPTGAFFVSKRLWRVGRDGLLHQPPKLACEISDLHSNRLASRVRIPYSPPSKKTTSMWSFLIHSNRLTTLSHIGDWRNFIKKCSLFSWLHRCKTAVDIGRTALQESM